MQNYSWQSQRQTPILETIGALLKKNNASFYTPGHKKGKGINKNLEKLIGKAVFRADLPELPELDNLFAPEGAIAAAQELAAETFGSEKTWFLINGSTCGVIAAILATCNPGEKIILPRNSHTSAIAGLILSGAIPIYIYPEYDPEIDCTYSITPETVKKALREHLDAKAVMMLYPTYQGICGELQAIAQIVHQYNIPLLVDEAHGAHFAFHPDLPPSALSAGADLSIQSTHKVLGAMSQASMLHLRGTRVDRQRISLALQLLQSTSPSYLLLASLDAARQQMALEGKKLINFSLELAEEARCKISQINGLSVLKPPKLPKPSFTFLDPTRLTVNLAQIGMTGFEADKILHQQLGVTAELPLLQNLTFIVTFGNTKEDINQLIEGLKLIASSNSQSSLPTNPLPPYPATSVVKLSPRDAAFAKTKTLPLEEAIGRVSAELICPYPPGIPVLMPGEAIAPEAVEYLKQVLVDGGTITGCSDSQLKTLKVVHQ